MENKNNEKENISIEETENKKESISLEETENIIKDNSSKERIKQIIEEIEEKDEEIEEIKLDKKVNEAIDDFFINSEKERIKKMSVKSHFMTTHLAIPKKNDLVVIIDDSKNIYTIEKVKKVESNCIETRSKIIPLALIKSFTVHKKHFNNIFSMFFNFKNLTIHTFNSTTSTIDYTEVLKHTVDSQLVKNFLKFKEHNVKDNFWIKMFSTVIMFGFVMFYVGNKLLSENTIKIGGKVFGNFTFIPPDV